MTSLQEKATVEATLYQAYLLRLWRESQDQPWRATLRQVGEERPGLNFPDLESVFDFLRERLDTAM